MKTFKNTQIKDTQFTNCVLISVEVESKSFDYLRNLSTFDDIIDEVALMDLSYSDWTGKGIRSYGQLISTGDGKGGYILNDHTYSTEKNICIIGDGCGEILLVSRGEENKYHGEQYFSRAKFENLYAELPE